MALAAAAFVVEHLHPELILRDTTATGGDTGLHVWAPWALGDLIESGSLSGWRDDWFGGFPAFRFYMVVPALAVTVLDSILPSTVAFKVVAAAGPAALPPAAYLLARAERWPAPAPALAAVATLPFLFDRSHVVWGGNLAADLAGEIGYSLSLAVGLAALAQVGAGLRDGGRRGRAGALAASAVLCHPIAGLLVAVGWPVRVLVAADRRGALRWSAAPAVAAVAATAFWVLPFVVDRAVTVDLGWERIDDIGGTLTGAREGSPLRPWVLVGAAVGAGAALARRRRAELAMAVTAAVFAAGVWLMPEGRLWNARLVPLWTLAVHLVAAVGLAAVVRGATSALAAVAGRRGSRRTERADADGAVIAVTVGLALVVLGWLALPLRSLPGGSTDDDGRYRWGPLSTTDQSFVSAWAAWNMAGYETKPGDATGGGWVEYRAVIDTIDGVGRQRGCGRAMWEAGPELVRYGTPAALALLPYWTDGCIDSMEGLYFESSASTPFHFVNQVELSADPLPALAGIDYPGFDMARGVDHLQIWGVRYYLAFSDQAVAAARAEPRLDEIADSGPWVIFEVAEVTLAEGLDRRPVVVVGTGTATGWRDAALSSYLGDIDPDVPLAAGGPDDWTRVAADSLSVGVGAPRLDPAQVSDVVVDHGHVRFRVDEVGRPVVVRVSWFPSWRATGADGPWRLAPNLMVVVPTEHVVELRFEARGVDRVAQAISVAGVVALVVVGRRRRPVSPAGVSEPVR